MHPIFADYVASIADFKQNTDSVLEQAQTARVVILIHNQPSTYLIPASVGCVPRTLFFHFQLPSRQLNWRILFLNPNGNNGN